MKLSSLECVKKCFGGQTEVDLEKQQAQPAVSTITKISNISKDFMSGISDVCQGASKYLPFISFSKVSPQEDVKDKKD